MNAAHDTQTLLSHVGWVRGLALELVRDAAEAEDAAQDALVSALEHPPRESGAWRGYLRTLLRNALLQRRRSDARRAARERIGARPEALPSTADSVERLAAHREVVEAVESLPEPFRGTVLLRYFDGLPPREIAARLSVPVKTVDSRLQRAHALLRERLDERHGGDRRAWAVAFLPLVERQPPTLAGPSPAVARAALLAAGLTIAFLAWTWIAQSNRGPDAAPLGSDLPKEVGGVAAADTLESLATDETRRTNAAPDRRAELSGRVHTSAGVPIAGAEVEVRFRPADGMKLRPGTYGETVEVLDRATTDAEGRFASTVPDDRVFDLRIRAAGFGVLRRPLVIAGGELEFVLEEAGTIACEVVDARGQPIAEVPIELCPNDSPYTTRDPWILGRTDAAGRWSTSEASPGIYLLTARPAYSRPILIRNVPVRVGETTERSVRLTEIQVVEGIVRAAGSREPVARCPVGTGRFDQRCTITDEEGRFRIENFGLGGATVWATAEGLGDLSVVVGYQSEAPVVRAALDLPRGHVVSGTLVRADGVPIAGAWVAAYGECGGPAVQLDWAEARSDERGAFSLTGVRDDLSHVLVVRSPGSASTIAVLPRPEGRDRIELGRIRTDAGAILAGVVRWDDGSPASGAIVTARRIDDLPTFATPGTSTDSVVGGESAVTSVEVGNSRSEPPARADDSTASVPEEILEIFAIAGEDGRFRVLDLAPGRYRVVARIGWLRSYPVEISRAAGQVDSDLRFEIARGLSIEGTVVAEDGGPIPGAWVLLYRGEKETLETRSESADQDGRFRMEGLEAIPYRIDAGFSTSTSAGGSTQPYARVQLLDVIPSRSDVVLRLPRTTRVEGRAIDAHGKPVARAVVNALGGDGRSVQSTSDIEGAFVLDVLPGDVLEVSGWVFGPGARHLVAKPSSFVAGSGELLVRFE